MKDVDLGIPTFGEDQKIDHEVYDKMRTDGEILERVVPLVIKENIFPAGIISLQDSFISHRSRPRVRQDLTAGESSKRGSLKVSVRGYSESVKWRGIDRYAAISKKMLPLHSRIMKSSSPKRYAASREKERSPREAKNIRTRNPKDSHLRWEKEKRKLEPRYCLARGEIE